jgi:hypothetical protein
MLTCQVDSEPIPADPEDLGEVDMTQRLIAYMSADFTEGDVKALRATAEELAQAAPWTYMAPSFIDESDASSCTRPEDEPVRTIGVALVVSAAGEVPSTPLDEAQRFLESLAGFSHLWEVDMEVLLDDTYVGEIRCGVMDHLLREGLLDQW